MGCYPARAAYTVSADAQSQWSGQRSQQWVAHSGQLPHQKWGFPPPKILLGVGQKLTKSRKEERRQMSTVTEWREPGPTLEGHGGGEEEEEEEKDHFHKHLLS